jgi:SPX domain protein involved in polyphosphate accumulation
MSQQRLQENRFELKYIVDEPKAHALRDFARSYLRPDEFADPNAGYSYPIHSLYLDNAGLHLCTSTIEGHKNRFKLRIRYYDDKPDSPVFFEVKRRVTDAILKKRAAVRRDAAMRLLAGHSPHPTDLLKPADVKAFDSLCQFCELRNKIDAFGKVIVSYVREAWVTPDNNSVRMTFDRNIRGSIYKNDLHARGLVDGAKTDIPGVVLELKFTDRFPAWMRDAVHIFNLQRCSVPKYVECIEATHMGNWAKDARYIYESHKEAAV